MLEVMNLHAKIGNKEILKGINLVMKDGETYAFMGSKGVSKSTSSAVLMDNALYDLPWMRKNSSTFPWREWMGGYYFCT